MKQVVLSEQAPKPIGPYSQGIKAGQFLFLSGQIPLDPKTGNLISQDIKEQTKQVLENMKHVLAASAITFEHIVKTTIFLQSMKDFPVVNEIYASAFSGTPPARSTLEVAALPKGALIEIEAIALIP